jgi:hypothetical protein
MDDRLDWVWYAFTVAWILHILYLVSISTREKKLREQVDYLKTLLKEHESKAGNR